MMGSMDPGRPGKDFSFSFLYLILETSICHILTCISFRSSSVRVSGEGEYVGWPGMHSLYFPFPDPLLLYFPCSF